MEFKFLAPNGPTLLIPQKWQDKRGYFMETFRQKEFVENCGPYEFVQDNQSKSTGNVLRGLHYQLPNPQGKLVRVIAGEVYDVAVDLRKNSPCFKKYYGVYLNATNNHIFWVPPGFAHGFLVMSNEAEFVYKCTSYYSPADERCLLWNDPEINIDWPCKSPVLSEKDARGVPLKDSILY